MATTLDPNDRAKLREILEQRFSLEELKTLAFDLGVDYDQVPHDTTAQLAIELIAHHQRRDTLNDLVTTVLKRRPTNDLEQLAAKLQHGAGRTKVQNTQPDFPVRNLPYRQNPNFTGREDLLTRLRSALISGKPAAVVQAIGGLGGVGKTQLALEYAYRHLDDYEVIWWMRAEHETTLASDYASLAGKLGLPGDTIKDQNLVVSIVRRWLEKEKNWLLIFDNAAGPSDIEPYLPVIMKGHVIITSRRLDWSQLASPLPIETFTPEEALQFLLAHTQHPDAEAAAQLASELGYLPLALEQARAYMESTHCTLTDYLQLFKTHQLEVLSRGASSPDYPYTVATTWELSFKQVADASPASVDLLNLCAFLAPEDIPLQVLMDGAKFLPEQLATTIHDPFRLDDAIKALLRYSLINRSRDSLAVHRLVRVVVREKMESEARHNWAASAVALINDAFQFDINDPQTWPTGCTPAIARAHSRATCRRLAGGERGNRAFT